MSNATTSSAAQHIAPLHHPGQEAVVVPPHAPLSNSSAGNNIPPSVKNTITMGSQMGAGQKALLMKRMASNKPSMVSPTDNMMSPCTAKLAGAKKKHFSKGRPMMLAQSFSAVADSGDDDDENVAPK